MSRRTSEASKAITAAWVKEKLLVDDGKGTRDWTPDQQADIQNKGKAYDENGKAYQGSSEEYSRENKAFCCSKSCEFYVHSMPCEKPDNKTLDALKQVFLRWHARVSEKYYEFP